MKTPPTKSKDDNYWDSFDSKTNASRSNHDNDVHSANLANEASDVGGGRNAKVLAAGAAAGAAGAVFGVPAFVSALGFTAEGIAAGSTAAAMMSAEAIASGTGGVAAGGLVSTLQSIGAVGLGSGATAGVALVGAAVGGAAAAGGVQIVKAFRGRESHHSGGCGRKCDISAIRPGNVIALHSPVHNRFICVLGEDVNGCSGRKSLDKLPSDWESVRLMVVDAGDGQIALYSVHQRRFISFFIKNVDASGDEVDIVALPPEDTCGSERFIVLDAGGGKIALYSKLHDRLVRMTFGGGVNANGKLGLDDIRFDVLLLNEECVQQMSHTVQSSLIVPYGEPQLS